MKDGEREETRLSMALALEGFMYIFERPTREERWGLEQRNKQIISSKHTSNLVTLQTP